jgi:hypothetical protein
MASSMMLYEKPKTSQSSLARVSNLHSIAFGRRRRFLESVVLAK